MRYGGKIVISTPDLEDVLLSRHGTWKGRELVFLCPNHDDHHPSARWSPEKKCWYCFVCGIGGGMKDLMIQLGLTNANDSTIRNEPFLPVRKDLPRIPLLDWRKYSHKLMLYCEDLFIHADPILTRAKGLDISNWTPEESDLAMDAVCDAMADMGESEKVADLVVNLRAYGLEEERARHEFRRQRAC